MLLSHTRCMLRFTHRFLLVISVALIACERDDPARPERNPSIDFRADSGYVYRSDTFPMNDTLRVGVTVIQGDDALRTFKVFASYDGAGGAMVDSLPITGGALTFEKTIITRDVTGSERWTFWVQERDGDIVRRALTFTVE